MPKKPVNKDDTEDDFEVEPDEVENDEEIEDSDVEDEEDDEKEEKENLVIDQDNDTTGCTIDEAIEDDNEYFENGEETEMPEEQSLEYVSKENRISSNRLTKYEMVRILGERTKQLTMGAKPLIKNHTGLSYDKISEEEFKRNMIPYKIKRSLQNGKFEIWTLDELLKDHLISLLD